MIIVGWIVFGLIVGFWLLAQINEWSFASKLKQVLGCNSIKFIANTHWYLLDGIEYDRGGNTRMYYNYLFCWVFARGLVIALVVFLCFPVLPKVCLIFAPLIIGGAWLWFGKRKLRDDKIFLGEVRNIGTEMQFDFKTEKLLDQNPEFRSQFESSARAFFDN